MYAADYHVQEKEPPTSKKLAHDLINALRTTAPPTTTPKSATTLGTTLSAAPALLDPLLVE